MNKYPLELRSRRDWLDVNVKDKQQKRIECRQRNRSMRKARTGCRRDSQHKHWERNSEQNKSLEGKVEKDLQVATKEMHPADLAMRFRGICPHDFFLTVNRIA